MIDAERALAVQPLGELAALLSDQHVAVEMLNEQLAQGVCLLDQDGSRWRLSYESSDASAPAAFALAQLVVQDAGFSRIKKCDRCGRLFIDRTAGRTGKRCAEHTRRPFGRGRCS